MTNKTKATIEEAEKLPTAKDTTRELIDAFSYAIGSDISISPKSRHNISAIAESYTAAHTAALRSDIKQLQRLLENSLEVGEELRERVKELETQNKRLKIAHYAIFRAYEEYGPLASVSTKQVSENVLKEIGFDPSKETL